MQPREVQSSKLSQKHRQAEGDPRERHLYFVFEFLELNLYQMCKERDSSSRSRRCAT